MSDGDVNVVHQVRVAIFLRVPSGSIHVEQTLKLRTVVSPLLFISLRMRTGGSASSKSSEPFATKFSAMQEHVCFTYPHLLSRNASRSIFLPNSTHSLHAFSSSLPNTRCREETLAQRHFESEWGFLLPDPATREEQKPALDGMLCKYFNPLGGTWTVREKKVPVPPRDPDEIDESTNPKSAAGVARNTHATLMGSIPANTGFITTSKQYGNRKSLEQFGISDYGVKAVITKL